MPTKKKPIKRRTLTPKKAAASPEKKAAPKGLKRRTQKSTQKSALPAPVPSGGSSAIADRFAQEQARLASGGEKTPYLKLGSGANRVRLVAIDGQVPFVRVRAHRITIGGNFKGARLDLDFVFNDPTLGTKMIQEYEALKPADFKLWKKYGDPFTSLAKRLQSLGREEEAKKAGLWGSNRYLFNAIDLESGEAKVFETSKTTFEAVAGIIAMYPQLLDPDEGHAVAINGNGEDGKKRRYSSPILEPKPTPVDIPEGGLLDLEAVAARRAVGFAEKAGALFSMHGALAASVGMGQNAFPEINLGAIADDDEDGEDEPSTED